VSGRLLAKEEVKITLTRDGKYWVYFDSQWALDDPKVLVRILMMTTPGQAGKLDDLWGPNLEYCKNI
jgi:hypothetical protein